MDLQELREQIDQVDDQLIQLFRQRMDIAASIAAYKQANGLPVFVPTREQEKLKDVAQKAGPEMANYTQILYATLFELSRSYQSKCSVHSSALYSKIRNAIDSTPRHFPSSPKVACLGAEGTYAQIACEKVFSSPNILYFNNSEGVFAAIEQGLCQYGILPIESATAGSAKKVYDLMVRHPFSIVRTLRMKNDHGTDSASPNETHAHEMNSQIRFICISKHLEIYPGADKTSIMMVLQHHPGALYRVLGRLYTLGIHVTKLESHPLPDQDLAFRFYFDLDASVDSDEFARLICELDELCETFTYLGSYSEVVS